MEENSENIERRRQSLKELRLRTAALLADRDMLKFHLCPFYEHEYVSRICVNESSAYNLENRFSRLYEKCRIISGLKEKGEEIDLYAVDDQVSALFREKDAELERKFGELKQRLNDSSYSLKIGKMELARLTSAYAHLAEKMSPDINPAETDLDREMFGQIQECYRNGNEGQMKIYSVIVGRKNRIPDDISEEEITVQTERLTRLMRETAAEIRGIKRRKPYIYRRVLDSKSRSAAVVYHLQKLSMEYKKLIIEYTDKISEMTE